MPVPGTKVRHSDIKSDFSSNMGLGHINTTSFLFGDDDEKTTGKKESTTSPDVNSYLQMNATNDKFPILLRHDEFPGVVGILVADTLVLLTGFCSSLRRQLL